MNLNSLLYLLAAYWPYLAAAGLIGAIVGWRSFTPPKP